MLTKSRKTILRGEPVRNRDPVRGPRDDGPRGGAAEAIVPPFVAFGLVLAAVGIVDIGLAWWPLRFGVGEWEFGTASRTFDSLALGTTGFVLLTVAASIERRVWALRTLAVAATVACVALLGVLMLYGLNAPIALGAITEQARPLLKQAMLRTLCFAGLYITLYGWLGWFTWRRCGAVRKGAGV